ncbi:hypothetical protein CGCF413_v000820 [Colletotrichum fructicola]|nr:hypothetical protein CGCF413_v000820 [Colletotrichum fructicola]
MALLIQNSKRYLRDEPDHDANSSRKASIYVLRMTKTLEKRMIHQRHLSRLLNSSSLQLTFIERFIHLSSTKE